MTLPPRTITPILGVAALALFALNFHRYIDHLWQEHEARHAFSDVRDWHIHMWHGERGDHHHRHRLYIRPEPGARSFEFEVPPDAGTKPAEPLRFKFETRLDTRDGEPQTVIIERTPSAEL